MSLFFWRAMILGITATIFMAVGAACGDDDEPTGTDDKVRVVTTLPLFADFVREVGGDRVEVTALLPSRADPHTWEPAPQDARDVSTADVAFANGLDLDHEAQELIEANLSNGAELILLGENARIVAVPAPHGIPGDDPHYWLDPYYASVYAGYIEQALAEADPENAAQYEANATDYDARLEEVESYFQERVDEIPEASRYLITTHEAFGHLAVFGLESAGAVAHAPGQEEGPEHLAELIEEVEARGLPAVFREPQVSGEGDTLEQLAEDAGVEVCVLYSDAFDDEIDTYIEMMRFNADELARCLRDDDGG